MNIIDKYTKLALAAHCKQYDAFKSSSIIDILGGLIQDPKEQELAKKAGEMYACRLISNAEGKDWASQVVQESVKEAFEIVKGQCGVDITSNAAVEALTAYTAIPYAQYLNPKATDLALCYAQAVALHVVLSHAYDDLMFGAVDGYKFITVMKKDTFDMVGSLCTKGEL